MLIFQPLFSNHSVKILSSAPIILFVFGVEKFQTEVETFNMKLFDVDFVL